MPDPFEELETFKQQGLPVNPLPASEVRRRGTPTGDVAEYREFGDAIEQTRARIAGTERPCQPSGQAETSAPQIAACVIHDAR